MVYVTANLDTTNDLEKYQGGGARYARTMTWCGLAMLWTLRLTRGIPHQCSCPTGLDYEFPQLPAESRNPLLHRERLYPSKQALVTWLAIHGSWFAVKISAAGADVPLLLSRPALGALGMRYDIAQGVAVPVYMCTQCA